MYSGAQANMMEEVVEEVWTQQHRGLLRTMDGMISAQLRCTEPHTPWFVENYGWDDICTTSLYRTTHSVVC